VKYGSVLNLCSPNIPKTTMPVRGRATSKRIKAIRFNIRGVLVQGREIT